MLDARVRVTRHAARRRGRRAKHGARANSSHRARRPRAPRRRPRPPRADPSAPDRTATTRRGCRATSAAPMPTGTPTAAIQPTCFITMRRTRRRLGAEREPQADLARALRDHVRQHAVEPIAASSVATAASAPASVTSSQSVCNVRRTCESNVRSIHDGQARIDARDDVAGRQRAGVSGGSWRARRTCARCRYSAGLHARQEELRRKRVLDRVVSRVANEPDDLDVRRRRRLASKRLPTGCRQGRSAARSSR